MSRLFGQPSTSHWLGNIHYFNQYEMIKYLWNDYIFNILVFFFIILYTCLRQINKRMSANSVFNSYKNIWIYLVLLFQLNVRIFLVAINYLITYKVHDSICIVLWVHEEDMYLLVGLGNSYYIYIHMRGFYLSDYVRLYGKMNLIHIIKSPISWICVQKNRSYPEWVWPNQLRSLLISYWLGRQ